MNDAKAAQGSELATRIFAGAGEAAALMRERDWAATPLGPVEAWPQSLRTAISLCLESRHPIVLWWGPERWMFYNDAYRPMLGERKHPQFLGGSGKECWAEIWDIIGPMMEQVIETGTPTWSEDLFLLMLRHGYLEETYFTFSYSPIRDESGRPAGIFNACSESTGRVLADRRMKALREMTVDARSAHEAAQRCAQVLAANQKDVPFALIYLTDHGNDRLKLLGCSGLQPGTPASPVSVAVDAAVDGAWPLAQVMQQGAPVLLTDLPQRFDCLPTAPWDEAAHQAMLVPIARPGSPMPAGVLVLGISPRRAFDEAYERFFELVGIQVATAVSNARAIEEQRQRAEQFAELDRAKTDFFNNVSHEFRTPLTLMLGPLEDALGTDARALQGASLESVHRNALRLTRLVNSLLDFSRLESGRLKPSFQATDLAVLTAGLAGSYQSLVESAGMKLVVECPPLPEPVYVDPAQWEKVVLNLVSNAFKFTFAGEIAVRLALQGDAVVLSVSDTGTGIPPEQLPRVFERFHRVEGAKGRSFEGTGIGLAMVHELVQQHGGRIEVHSEVGRGSTFTVSLPRGRAHLPAEQVVAAGNADPAKEVRASVLEASQWLSPAADEAVEAPDAAPTGRARLLVADDNADMREYLQRLLSPRWQLELVADGEEALASALRDPPDLVLSDIMMPRMDGVSLLRRLREEDATAHVPVILLSARAGEEAIVAGLETGADDYLIKPFSARELVTRVGSHLELARTRRLAAEAARELAETRAVLLLDLEAKNKELETFSYSVSHDLRAPLRAVDGFSKILVEDFGSSLPEEAHRTLQRIGDGVRRMDELINDLLRLSRVSQGRLAQEDVDLGQLACKALNELRQREPSRVVEFLVAPELRARGDARLLEIVFENLVGNAWKFTGRTAQPRIEIGSELQDGAEVFYVRDNGAGFDMKRADKLFAPFQRLHPEEQFPGTGIGLATVRRIVARHGGRIWAHAEVDRGATFYFTLPEIGV